MKVALIGYGKMGRVLEKLAPSLKIEIVSIIDPQVDSAFSEINEESVKGVDVCIDFTHPSVIIDNIKKVAGLNKNIVVGTTGWYDKMGEVEKIVKENKIGLIWSGNFSLGVNMFFAMIENAAKIMNNVPEYDVFAYELHHNQKADSPSGTAKMIADRLLDNMTRKKKIVTEKLDRKITNDEIHFASVRGGSIPGTHVVGFDSLADTIEIKHTARNREGFALGALKAAEFIKGKKGLFTINDLMETITR
jgi:4-hydroxy-tetrahydrodipicolinate reductase